MMEYRPSKRSLLDMEDSNLNDIELASGMADPDFDPYDSESASWRPSSPAVNWGQRWAKVLLLALCSTTMAVGLYRGFVPHRGWPTDASSENHIPPISRHTGLHPASSIKTEGLRGAMAPSAAVTADSRALLQPGAFLYHDGKALTDYLKAVKELKADGDYQEKAEKLYKKFMADSKYPAEDKKNLKAGWKAIVAITAPAEVATTK